MTSTAPTRQGTSLLGQGAAHQLGLFGRKQHMSPGKLGSFVRERASAGGHTATSTKRSHSSQRLLGHAGGIWTRLSRRFGGSRWDRTPLDALRRAVMKLAILLALTLLATTAQAQTTVTRDQFGREVFTTQRTRDAVVVLRARNFDD
jgi:hypothetical protein